MKLHSVFLLVVFAATFPAAHAQKLHVGVQAGTGFSTLAVPNPSSTDLRDLHGIQGYQFGAWMAYESESPLGISLESNYLSKGGLQKAPIIPDLKIRLNYLNVLPLLTFRLTDKLRMVAGPEFSFLLSGEGTNSFSTTDFTELYDQGAEIAVLAGLQYRLHDRLDVGLRASRGLSYVSEISWTNGSGESDGNSREYNTYLQLILRFRII